MMMVAGFSLECCFSAAQSSGSGFQVCEAACWGVRAGGRLVAETQRGSIGPSVIGSPTGVVTGRRVPSANRTSMCQLVVEAEGARQRNVGGLHVRRKRWIHFREKSMVMDAAGVDKPSAWRGRRRQKQGRKEQDRGEVQKLQWERTLFTKIAGMGTRGWGRRGVVESRG